MAADRNTKAGISGRWATAESNEEWRTGEVGVTGWMKNAGRPRVNELTRGTQGSPKNWRQTQPTNLLNHKRLKKDPDSCQTGKSYRVLNCYGLPLQACTEMRDGSCGQSDASEVQHNRLGSFSRFVSAKLKRQQFSPAPFTRHTCTAAVCACFMLTQH